MVEEKLLNKVRNRIRQRIAKEEDIHQIVLLGDDDASLLTAQALAEPLSEKHLEAVVASSNKGKQILQQLGAVSVPTHLEKVDGHYREGDLKNLFKQFITDEQ